MLRIQARLPQLRWLLVPEKPTPRRIHQRLTMDVVGVKEVLRLLHWIRLVLWLLRLLSLKEEVPFAGAVSFSTKLVKSP
jgi:hypothetical protein